MITQKRRDAYFFSVDYCDKQEFRTQLEGAVYFQIWEKNKERVFLPIKQAFEGGYTGPGKSIYRKDDTLISSG